MIRFFPRRRSLAGAAMAPSLSRCWAASPGSGLHLPCVAAAASCAATAASRTTAAFSRSGPSVNSRSLSRAGSSSSSSYCSVPSVRWNQGDRRAGFRCEVSAAAEEAPGDEHQVSHLLDSVIQKLCNHKEVFLQDIDGSSGQCGLEVDDIELVKDKLLINCGPDQECVTGGIVALGKFDALHIGHRELAVQASKAGTPFLLSFVGMAEVLGWEYRAPIVAKCDRRRVLSSWAAFCGSIPPLEFQVEFSKVRYLTPRQFVERLSKELRISGVVAGENYRFGYRASGDTSELVRLCKEYGLEAYIVSPVLDSKSNNLSKRELVSSTRVRQALAVGDMKCVSELLGRKHRLVLTANKECVVEGKKLSIPKSCMLNQQPKDGFYDICSLLIDDMLVGPCRLVTDARNILVELDSTSEWAFPNWSCQHVSIEFG